MNLFRWALRAFTLKYRIASIKASLYLYVEG